MSRYTKVKEQALARKRGTLSLSQVEMALDDTLSKVNSMMPFDIQREGNFLYVLALAPKHNFFVRRNKPRHSEASFIVKRIHDFEKENNFFEETKHLKTLKEITSMFDEYIATINDYLERNK